MGKTMNGRELGLGIYQRPNGTYGPVSRFSTK